ncbi:MAG: hypothetical protein QW059_05300 [Nitrososphaerota archaeon]
MLRPKVLRRVLHGARWPGIKNELDINDKTLNDVLKALSDAFIVEKRDGFYVIDDPVTWGGSEEYAD